MPDKNNKAHECGWDTVAWNCVPRNEDRDLSEMLPVYESKDHGQILEREGKCRTCGKEYVMVYALDRIDDCETFEEVEFPPETRRL